MAVFCYANSRLKRQHNEDLLNDEDDEYLDPQLQSDPSFYIDLIISWEDWKTYIEPQPIQHSRSLRDYGDGTRIRMVPKRGWFEYIALKVGEEHPIVKCALTVKSRECSITQESQFMVFKGRCIQPSCAVQFSGIVSEEPKDQPALVRIFFFGSTDHQKLQQGERRYDTCGYDHVGFIKKNFFIGGCFIQ
jgi:hypothetical protein